MVPWYTFAAALAGAVAVSCGDDPSDWEPREWTALLSLTGLGDPPVDPSNRYSSDPAAATLGRRFYFDADFSGLARGVDALGRYTPLVTTPVGQPARFSCASCHDLARGGADVVSVPGHISIGAGATDVNAQPTFNSAYHKIWFWNGRIDSLWGLNFFVGEAGGTMNGTRLQTAHVIEQKYATEFDAVFANELPTDWRERAKGFPPTGKPGAPAYMQMAAEDQRLATQILALWSKAIAAFERTLVSRDSDFDFFMQEGPRSQSLSPLAQRGARLFVGKASCIDCHNGPLLTDDDFHNIGVPQRGQAVPTVSECQSPETCDCRPPAAGATAPPRCLPWGAGWGLWVLRDPTNQNQRIVNPFSDEPVDRDSHRKSLRERPLDTLRGAWRTPSLRDAALTAPYMHNGVFRTLEEVIWHYNTGGKNAVAERVGKPAAQLAPLHLSQNEQAELIAFLRALTARTVEGKPRP